MVSEDSLHLDIFLLLLLLLGGGGGGGGGPLGGSLSGELDGC